MLQGFLHWIGFGLCHQLPERSFFGGGVQVPVCARDTGIYFGFMISLAVVAIVHRGERPRGFPRMHVWVLMGLLLVLMGWDGVSSYSGLRTTTNDLRLLTGLGVGFSAAVVIYPMLQDELWTHPTPGRVLDPVWRFTTWAASMFAAFAALRWGAPLLGLGYPLAAAGAIIATLTTINLVVVAMLPAFDRKASSVRQILVPIAISMVIAFAEIELAALLRAWIDAMVKSVS